MGGLKYRYTLSASIGGDIPTWEGEITVGYNIQPGEPETGPTYDCGGTPASDPCVIDVTLLEIDGKARPWGDPFNTDQDLAVRFEALVEDFEDEMLEAAFGQEAA